jgi:hypothetical protein
MADKRLLELAVKGLEAERQRIDQELADLQRQLGTSSGASTASRTGKAAKPGRGGLTAAGRKRLSELMRKRWAERRKAAGKSR